ncbi:hypothetical protein SNE40_004808 [Patella caerulea]|uniref:Uncharacterized protein n=1 Tax=Patella caerulea TaxID=87958 RepID=A0AAN8K3R7_PATCE
MSSKSGDKIENPKGPLTRSSTSQSKADFDSSEGVADKACVLDAIEQLKTEVKNVISKDDMEKIMNDISECVVVKIRTEANKDKREGCGTTTKL